MTNSELLDNVLAFASILSVFILALVQLIKNNTRLPRKVIPFAGLGIGVLIGAAAYPFTDLSITLRLWAAGLPDCLLLDYLSWLLMIVRVLLVNEYRMFQTIQYNR